MQIQWSVVERTTKADVSDIDALKSPARVLKSGRIDGANVEKRRNQITIGSIRVPNAVPRSVANATSEQTIMMMMTSTIFSYRHIAN